MAEAASAEAELESFEAYARRVSARNARMLACLVLGATIGFWPTDVLIYDDPAIWVGFARWRAVMALTTVVALAIIVPERGRRWVIPTAAVVIAANALFLGREFATLGGLDRGWFQAAYLAPFASGILLLPIGARIAFTLGETAVFLGSYFLLGPPRWELERGGTALALLSVACAMSILFGHALYRTFETNHRQRTMLDERARRLEDLDQLKNDLFANVSHELRTPLTLILGQLRALRRDLAEPSKPGADSGARIGTAERNAARLLVLIEELLELARLTSGRSEPRKRTVDLGELVREIASNFRPSSPDEGALVVDAPGDVLVEVDARQIRTAIHNLLSNAWKFSEIGQRFVEVRVAREGDGVLVSVTDNGIGISPRHLSRIFERFYRVERGPARARGGTGIGLALVNEIAEAHGGRVDVESELGRGSRFTVRLPTGTPDAQSAREPASDQHVLTDLSSLHALTAPARQSRPMPVPPDAQRGARETCVVVAEDDPDLRRYISEVLGRHHRVIVASDGAEALQCARVERPDALVTDMMMPRMSGLDLARAIRSEPPLARLPILFLTARSGVDSRAEAYESGAADFLNKPFHEAELLARVDNLIKLRRTERELDDLNRALELRVQERTDELRRLAQHIQEVGEAERRRLARELHDETGQLLTALRMEVDLATQAPIDDPRLSESLARLSSLAEETITATRAIVAELRPRVLDDLGLGPAVEWYLEQFSRRAVITCVWRVEPADMVASPTTSTAIYRVLQEALTNVVKHSGAREVDVSLQRVANEISLCVRDDGRGMGSDDSHGGFGLLGMRERAAAAGGRFTIDAASPSGTRLTLVLPASEEQLR